MPWGATVCEFLCAGRQSEAGSARLPSYRPSALCAHMATNDDREWESLQKQLIDMEEESERLRAVIELEEMKAALLGLSVSSEIKMSNEQACASTFLPPSAPRTAWGEEGAEDAEPKHVDELSAEDEARLERLFSDEDQDDDFRT